MKNKIEKTPGCVAFAAMILGDSWNIMIVKQLHDGPLRFSALQTSIGINPRTLSAKLDMLEENGILTRTQFAQVPVRVEYQLTEKGQDLIPILHTMASWGEKYNKA